MSRTDKDRPYWVSGRDMTEPGQVRHRCARWGRHCDYDPERQPRKRQEYDDQHCRRLLDHWGGVRSLGGAAKNECKRRRRNVRQRERRQLRLAMQLGREAEFDLLPRREDRNTVHYDLT